MVIRVGVRVRIRTRVKARARVVSTYHEPGPHTQLAEESDIRTEESKAGQRDTK